MEAPALVFHQSDLQAYNRCPQELHLKRLGRVSRSNSRSAYGSVMHHALAVLERTHDLDKALATFEHYWHPLNIDAICDPVPGDGWIAHDTYGALLRKGRDALRKMDEVMRLDDGVVLAIEYEFVLPVVGTPFWIAGTLDRLSGRWRKGARELGIEDYKTGKQPAGLRHHVQGHSYGYASTRPEFWLGNGPVQLRRFGSDEVVTYQAHGFGEERGRELMERFDGVPRRYFWIDVRSFAWKDGGYRGPQDYERLRRTLHELARMEEADVWPLRIDGSTCEYCDFRKVCGDTPVPDDHHGDPFA